jgi:hypothetical protein
LAGMEFDITTSLGILFFLPLFDLPETLSP